MINPYGVQRDYGLWLEEVERRDGQARGLAHEVGRARRCKRGTEAELRHSLAAAPQDDRTPRGSGRFRVLDFLRGPRPRPARETYA